MKKCITCKQEKELTEFHKHIRKSDGLQSQCKTCNIKSSQDYYIRNKKRQQKTANKSKIKRRLALKTWLKEIKTKCCICFEDCHEALDFHHIGSKEFSIGEAVASTKPKHMLIKEISKCIILCSNCHRKYHANLFCLLSDKHTG